jgi:Flp pilus assembly protein TadB
MEKQALIVALIALLVISIGVSHGKNRVLVRHKAENKALKHQIDSLTSALDVCVGGIE